MRRREFNSGVVASMMAAALAGCASGTPAAQPRHVMKQLPHWPYRSYNRGRWPNDRGTLNLIGPDAARRAVTSLQSFETLSLGAPLRIDDANLRDNVYAHEMTAVGRYSFDPDDDALQVASDRISVDVHGMTNTHIDALSHLAHHGLSFNDAPFESVVSMRGANRFSILEIPALVTRAWFIDVPRARGLTALTPGTPVRASDLRVLDGQVEPGDALVIRTGRYATPVVPPDAPEAEDNHGNWSGLHVDCLDVIADWDVATVATDSSGDNFPSTTDECSVPIHIVSEAYLGMPLIHHLDLETLAASMAGRSSTSFMLCVAPLKISGGTGSPVNPVAII